MGQTRYFIRILRVAVGEVKPHRFQPRRLLHRDEERAEREDLQLLEAWGAHNDVPRPVDVVDLQMLQGGAPRDQAAEVGVRGDHVAEPSDRTARRPASLSGSRSLQL